MFVYNVKIRSGKIFKILFALMFIVIIAITSLAIYKTFFSSKTNINMNDVYEIPVTNYTNILKAVHDDMNNYIGQKISFSGYIYRVYDLKDNEFILARDMVVDSKHQTLVVGFLCNSENAKNFDNGTWVSIVGEIKKGYYHGDIPIIEISSIEKITKPKDEYVYPPDDYYIPTTSLLYNSSY